MSFPPFPHPMMGRGDKVPTWNVADKSSNVTLSNGSKTATGDGSATAGVRALNSYSAGKLLFNIRNDAPNVNQIGLIQSGVGLTTVWFNTAQAIVYQPGNGTVSAGAASVGTAALSSGGDVVSFAVDFTNSRIWVAVNNGNWNNSGSADPGSNVGGFDISGRTAGAYFPAARFASGSVQPYTLVPVTRTPAGFSPII